MNAIVWFAIGAIGVASWYGAAQLVASVLGL
jgi:hypothetical protein